MVPEFFSLAPHETEKEIFNFSVLKDCDTVNRVGKLA